MVYGFLNKRFRKNSAIPIINTNIPINHNIIDVVKEIFNVPEIKIKIKTTLAIKLIIIAPSNPRPLIPFSLYCDSIYKAMPMPNNTAPKIKE